MPCLITLLYHDTLLVTITHSFGLHRFVNAVDMHQLLDRLVADTLTLLTIVLDEQVADVRRVDQQCTEPASAHRDAHSLVRTVHKASAFLLQCACQRPAMMHLQTQIKAIEINQRTFLIAIK